MFINVFFGFRKTVNAAILLLMLFVAPQSASAAISNVPGDCLVIFDTAEFNLTNTSYSDTSSGILLVPRYYYFTVNTAGSITISTNHNQTDLLYNETSCPVLVGGGTSTITKTFTEATDFIITIYGNSANLKTYTLTANFTPAPISLQKQNVPSQILENNDSTVRYTLIGKNNYPSDISDVTITDTLPSEANLSTFNIIDDGGWSCGLSGSDLTCSCTGSCSLNSGSSVLIDFNVTLSAGAAGGGITNTAEMTFASDLATASSVVDVVDGKGEVELKVEKYAEANAIPVDTDFSYFIFVTNYKNAQAFGLSVTDQMDPNVYYMGYNSNNGWICTPPAPYPANLGQQFSCYYTNPLGLGKGITYFEIYAHTADANTTGVTPDLNVTATNNVDLSTLNQLDDSSVTEASADINITYYEVPSGGGTIGGVYQKGGIIEVSDISFGDRIDARLQTKVASKGNLWIRSYFLDGEGSDASPVAYNLSPAASSNPVPLTVIIRLANDQCEEESLTTVSYGGKPLTAIFNPDSALTYTDAGVSTAGIPEAFQMRNLAVKKGRFVMKYIDINKKLDDAGEHCVQTSTTNGNLKGIPQCLNAGGSSSLFNNKYLNVFGTEAFVRCLASNGNPCDSSNNGYSCGGDQTCPGYNPEYDHEYGCYECTIGGIGYCSNDNFAIRPKAFDTNITDYVSGGAPLKAGKDYGLQFKGLTANTAVPTEATISYDEVEDILTDGTTFHIDLNISDPAKACPQPNVNMTPQVHFSNGVETGLFRFDNVGDINFSIHETNGTEFSKVDVNDTAWADRRIEPFSLAFRIIPDHFEVEAALDDFGNDYTYLYDMNKYDDYNSSTARLSLDINATGADDNVTSNYMETCYAKDTNVTLQMSGTEIKPSGALTHFLYYNPEEDDGTADSGEGNYSLPGGVITKLPIENLAASFPPDAPDGNGTTHIEYKLNFDRKVNKVVDPFRFALTRVDVNDSEPSPYTVYGYDDTTDTATFLYGRAHAPRYRVNCGTTNTGPCMSQNLGLFFEFYGSNDTNLTLRRQYAQDSERSKDAILWYRNTKHDSAADSNITHLSHKYFGYDLNTSTSPLYLSNTIATPTHITAPVNGISQVRIGYTGNSGYPYKASVNIHTQKWLNYDRFNPDPDLNASFLIEFNAIGVEAGEGDLGGTDSGPANSNRRIRWQ